MHPSLLELFASLFFAVAIIHTFGAPKLHSLASRHPDGSIRANLFELLGEVELVFGLWAGLFVCILFVVYGTTDTLNFVHSISFTEPAFVFAIMCVAATRPLLWVARKILLAGAKLIPLKPEPAFLISTLTLGPWLGSLITEPAAMTLTALILKERFFDRNISTPLKYALIGTLFVNISIGGTLTHFAAPPVVMVAQTWNWDTAQMFSLFGYKAIIAGLLNTIALWFFFRKELNPLRSSTEKAPVNESGHNIRGEVPLWLVAIHILFLGLIILTNHYMALFLPLFLFFIGVTHVTREYQTAIQLRESLLVGLFLGGLVVLGKPQAWWLTPLLRSLGDLQLFIGTTALTALTDNSALTYLGSQVSGLSDSLKYSLVAGAVAGGGLSIIANAPNPAGYAILQPTFGPDGIRPLGLLLGALPPTVIAALCLWFLP
mgnify:CR=1 FL=1